MRSLLDGRRRWTDLGRSGLLFDRLHLECDIPVETKILAVDLAGRGETSHFLAPGVLSGAAELDIQRAAQGS